jgi:3-oxoacyl-[acyl-carrier-protein] synthase-1
MGAVVVAAGVITCVGLSLMETAAATRARVARLREIDWLDRHFEPFIVGAVPDDGLPALDDAFKDEALSAREARMLQLGHAALAQVAGDIARHGVAIPLLLGLPEPHGDQPIDAKRFLERLRRQCGLALEPSTSAVAACGRAAGVMAVKHALARLERPDCPMVLVGGVDTLIDLSVLGDLDAQGRVRGESNSDGFSPGEGAAFLLLASESWVRETGLPALAHVRGGAVGRESGHLYSDEPYRGDGLAAAFTDLLTNHPPSAPIGSMYASLNGEHYWARELGTARIRNARHFAEDLQMEHPAECFGDLGAAFGPALVALAAHALAGDYRRSPCLAYASSDRGERAALLLERASPTSGRA